MRTAIGSIPLGIACALALAAAPGAWAQQKQTMTYKVTAEGTKYPQRHTLDVGDAAGHSLSLYEIHRVFGADAPLVNGMRVKEIWTRGHGDYIDNNGASHNYSIYVLENGDRFFVTSTTMGQANAAGRRMTSSVGQVTGGTGQLVGMQGVFRAQGASEGKIGFNETNAELVYWFAK